MHSRGPKRRALKCCLTNLPPATRWVHPRSVSRKVKKYDSDGFVDRKQIGRTHVRFGDPTEYAKELGINGIVSGPDCRKPSGRTQAAFGESTGF